MTHPPSPPDRCSRLPLIAALSFLRPRAAGPGSARRQGFSSFSPSPSSPNPVLPLAHHAEIPIVTGYVVVRREGSFNVAIHRRPSPYHHLGCADESLITSSLLRRTGACLPRMRARLPRTDTRIGWMRTGHVRDVCPYPRPFVNAFRGMRVRFPKIRARVPHIRMRIPHARPCNWRDTLRFPRTHAGMPRMRSRVGVTKGCVCRRSPFESCYRPCAWRLGLAVDDRRTGLRLRFANWCRQSSTAIPCAAASLRRVSI